VSAFLLAGSIDLSIVIGPVDWIEASDQTGTRVWGFEIESVDAGGRRTDQIDGRAYETAIKTRAELLKALRQDSPDVILHDATDKIHQCELAMTLWPCPLGSDEWLVEYIENLEAKRMRQ
jgi:hypothetical protein